MLNYIVNKAYIVAIISLLCISIGLNVWKKDDSEVAISTVPSLEQASVFFKDAKRVGQNSHFSAIVYGAYNKQLGVVLNTTPFCEKYYGYAGPVPVLLGIDINNVITGIEMLPNDETPNYNKKIKNKYLPQWIGVNCNDTIQKNIDAISGATMSSNAFGNGIKSTIAYIYNNKAVVETNPYANIIDFILFTLLIVLALLVYFIKQWRKARVLLLIASGIVLGFIVKTTLSVAMLQGIINNGFNFTSGLIPLILLLVASLMALIGNQKFYCNYVCPYGALQELTSRYSPLKKRSFGWLLKSELNFRIVLLCSAVVIAIYELNVDISLLEPFAAFSLLAAPISVIVLAIIFLALSLVVNKPWCNYFCPTGQLFDLLIVKKDASQKRVSISPMRLAILFFAILVALQSYKNYNTQNTQSNLFTEEIESTAIDKNEKRSIGTKIPGYPKTVVLVGSYDSIENPNVMTCAWTGIVNSKPPMVSISLRKATYTHGSIIQNKAFTVNIPSENLVAEVDYAGLFSGHNENKFETLKLTPIKGSKVNAPYINECPLIIECILENTVNMGSHTQFIGKIVDVKANENIILPNKTIDIKKLKAIVVTHEGYYSLGENLGRPFKIGQTLVDTTKTSDKEVAE